MFGSLFGIGGQVFLAFLKRPFLTMIFFTLGNSFWVYVSIFVHPDVSALCTWGFYLVSSAIGIYTWFPGRKQNGSGK